MVLTKEGNLVYDIKFSSVVPAQVTGGNLACELSSMDLVMKLHYLRGVYFFTSDAVQGLTITDLKKPMFKWLELFYVTTGRIRRSEMGRPFVKCNDSGARIIEARCSKTLDEWLEMNDHQSHNLLVSNQVIGPELSFTPLVLIQFTWFKCGGISVGLSWPHVLGDAFSASSFINMWGQMMAGHMPPELLKLQPKSQTKAEDSKHLLPIFVDPLPLKQIEPVGDYWTTSNTCKMGTFSFQITAKQLKDLQAKICEQSQTSQIPPFETLCTVIWKCWAKTKEGSESRVVTVCREKAHNRENGRLSNNQILSVIKANVSVVEANTSELATLIAKQMVDGKSQIEEIVERDQGLSDFIVYGANLTFVDLEDVKLYGLELKGQKPVIVSYTIDGIGDEGVVLVLPGPENVEEEDAGRRIVTIILEQNQLELLRYELKREWCIA